MTPTLGTPEDARRALEADVAAGAPEVSFQPGSVAEIDARAITWEAFVDLGDWRQLQTGEVMQAGDYIAWSAASYIEVIPGDTWIGNGVGVHLSAYRLVSVPDPLPDPACAVCGDPADAEGLCKPCDEQGAPDPDIVHCRECERPMLFSEVTCELCIEDRDRERAAGDSGPPLCLSPKMRMTALSIAHGNAFVGTAGPEWRDVLILAEHLISEAMNWRKGDE